MDTQAHLLRLHEFQGEDKQVQFNVLIASSSGEHLTIG